MGSAHPTNLVLPAIFRGIRLSDDMMLYLDVDPRVLFLAPSRMSGADPMKLREQFRRFGTSTKGMPPIEVNRDAAGEMVIYDGVTRATRLAILGRSAPVVVTRHLRRELSKLPIPLPRLGDVLPSTGDQSP
jgi:hypothetical protein